jgi:hypothetical protein
MVYQPSVHIDALSAFKELRTELSANDKVHVHRDWYPEVDRSWQLSSADWVTIVFKLETWVDKKWKAIKIPAEDTTIDLDDITLVQIVPGPQKEITMR